MGALAATGIVVGVLSGLTGMGLGIWNRLQQNRESRVKRADRTPYFSGTIEAAEEGKVWRRVTLAFQTPQRIGAKMYSVEVVRPRHVKLRWKPPEKDAAFRIGRKIDVVWGFKGTDQPRNYRPEATLFCDLSGADELELRVKGMEWNAIQTRWMSRGDIHLTRRRVSASPEALPTPRSSGPVFRR